MFFVLLIVSCAKEFDLGENGEETDAVVSELGSRSRVDKQNTKFTKYGLSFEFYVVKDLENESSLQVEISDIKGKSIVYEVNEILGDVLKDVYSNQTNDDVIEDLVLLNNGSEINHEDISALLHCSTSTTVSAWVLIFDLYEFYYDSSTYTEHIYGMTHHTYSGSTTVANLDCNDGPSGGGGSGGGTENSLSNLSYPECWKKYEYVIHLSSGHMFMEESEQIDYYWELNSIHESCGCGGVLNASRQYNAQELKFLRQNDLTECSCSSDNNAGLNYIANTTFCGDAEDIIDEMREDCDFSAYDTAFDGIAKVEPSNDWLNCKYLKCIWDQLDLTNNTVFESSLCDIINDDEYTLVLDVSSGADGYTRILDEENKEIRMIINAAACSDHPFNDTPPDFLEIAETILHEGHHVFFRYDFSTSIGTVSETEFRDAWKLYASERLGITYNSEEHYVMINEYIDYTAQALFDLNGGLHTIDHYKYLVYQGFNDAFPFVIEQDIIDNWKNLYNSIKDEPYAFSCD